MRLLVILGLYVATFTKAEDTEDVVGWCPANATLTTIGVDGAEVSWKI